MKLYKGIRDAQSVECLKFCQLVVGRSEGDKGNNDIEGVGVKFTSSPGGLSIWTNGTQSST